MIEPPSPAAIREPKSAVSRNGPLRFTPMILSNSSSLVSSRRRRERRHAGIVDQHVGPPPARVDLVGETVAVLPFADVRGVRRAVAAERADFLDGLLAGIELAARDRELGAGGRRTRAPSRGRCRGCRRLSTTTLPVKSYCTGRVVIERPPRVRCGRRISGSRPRAAPEYGWSGRGRRCPCSRAAPGARA